MRGRARALVAAGGGNGHELDIHPGPPTLVRALDDDLAVILDNLIENALVYAPAGTRVTLTWSEDGRLVVLDEGGESRPARGRSSRASIGVAPIVPERDRAIVKLLAERWGGSASTETATEAAPASRSRFPSSSGRGSRRERRRARDPRVRRRGGTVGFAIHALTRETIALPVVQLEQGASLAPPAARAQAQPATTTTTTTTARATTTRTGSTEDRTETDDSGSGRGRGRNRGRGGDDD